MTWFQTAPLQSTEDICLKYGLRGEDVRADRTLAEFVYFMKYALILVRAKGHMEFLISDVVAPLSEKLSGKRYPPGGGSESIGTVMRYAVFERETGLVRPKSRPAPTLCASSLCDPVGQSYPQQHPLVASRKRRRVTRLEAASTLAPADRSVRRNGVNCADSLSVVSGDGEGSDSFSEENDFELIDFEGQSVL
jgi:hypothetical protein